MDWTVPVNGAEVLVAVDDHVRWRRWASGGKGEPARYRVIAVKRSQRGKVSLCLVRVEFDGTERAGFPTTVWTSSGFTEVIPTTKGSQ